MTIVSILDKNNVGFVNKLPVCIALVPWLSALQAVGLVRRNINRKLGLATHIISVKHDPNIVIPESSFFHLVERATTQF